MSQENQAGGCCGGESQQPKSSGGCGCCCKVKKLVVALIVIGLSFVAGVMFAKSCPLAKGKMCPMSGGMPAAQ